MPGKSKLLNLPNETKVQNSNFEFNVQEAQDRINFFNSEFPKLGQEFFSLMADKTLAKNKGPQEKKSEVQLLQKLSMLAEQMNIDETQKESAGSMALLTIVLVSLRDIRDRINFLEFDLRQQNTELQNKLSKLEENAK